MLRSNTVVVLFRLPYEKFHDLPVSMMFAICNSIKNLDADIMVIWCPLQWKIIDQVVWSRFDLYRHRKAVLIWS